MAPRLTVTEFVREVLDQRTPLFYAIAAVLGASRAGDVYAATANIPEALLLGTTLGLALFVLMCTVTWFVMRIRGA
ncbi:hypothetical protein [Cryptosporangium sp. NPDC048952]|uniref:hypothetical protein n=1 Tax=Cryptosporangium sp. NPDC048952 TaxID=3363961 RepID=UPI0037144B6E